MEVSVERSSKKPLWSSLIPVFIGRGTEGSLCYTQAENHHMGRVRLCTQQTGTLNEKYYKTSSAANPSVLPTLFHLCLPLLAKQFKWENRLKLSTFAFYLRGKKKNLNALKFKRHFYGWALWDFFFEAVVLARGICWTTILVDHFFQSKQRWCS